jgi:hypothetical protein
MGNVQSTPILLLLNPGYDEKKNKGYWRI